MAKWSSRLSPPVLMMWKKRMVSEPSAICQRQGWRVHCQEGGGAGRVEDVRQHGGRGRRGQCTVRARVPATAATRTLASGSAVGSPRGTVGSVMRGCLARSMWYRRAGSKSSQWGPMPVTGLSCRRRSPNASLRSERPERRQQATRQQATRQQAIRQQAIRQQATGQQAARQQGSSYQGSRRCRIT